jgi:hypothetical protein
MMVTIQRTVYVATRRCILLIVNSVCQPLQFLRSGRWFNILSTCTPGINNINEKSFSQTSAIISKCLFARYTYRDEAPCTISTYLREVKSCYRIMVARYIHKLCFRNTAIYIKTYKPY